MMVYEHSCSKSLEEIDAALREAVGRHKFGVLGVHDLQQAMRNKGVEYGDVCMVYEVCNPQQAKRVLETDAAFSTMLPCRISVYGSQTGYRIATLLPTAMMKVVGAPGAAEVAREVEGELIEIIKEAAV